MADYTTDYTAAVNGGKDNGEEIAKEEQGTVNIVPQYTTTDTQNTPMNNEETEENMDTQSPPVNTCDANVTYDQHKLFVGGLHPATNEQTLKEYFSKYGTLTEVKVKYEEGPSGAKRSKGYAFLIFQEDDAIDKLLAQGPHTIDDKVVDAKKSIPHEIHQQMKLRTKKVFVGGVPTDMPEETIRKYFEQFGEIDDVALVTQKGESVRRGFCFVTFSTLETANKVCSLSHKIEEAEVEVKHATPRDQGKGQHYSSHSFGGRGRGHFVQSHGGGRGQFAPYGGHAGYYGFYGPPPAPYGGGYMGGGYGGGYGGYGGYSGYEQFPPHPSGGGGGRRDDARYGPMRSNYGHTHSAQHHPYSR